MLAGRFQHLGRATTGFPNDWAHAHTGGKLFGLVKVFQRHVRLTLRGANPAGGQVNQWVIVAHAPLDDEVLGVAHKLGRAFDIVLSQGQ